MLQDFSDYNRFQNSHSIIDQWHLNEPFLIIIDHWNNTTGQNPHCWFSHAGAHMALQPSLCCNLHPVRNPEDRFSHDKAHFEHPLHESTCLKFTVNLKPEDQWSCKRSPDIWALDIYIMFCIDQGNHLVKCINQCLGNRL